MVDRVALDAKKKAEAAHLMEALEADKKAKLVAEQERARKEAAAKLAEKALLNVSCAVLKHPVKLLQCLSGKAVQSNMAGVWWAWSSILLLGERCSQWDVCSSPVLAAQVVLQKRRSAVQQGSRVVAQQEQACQEAAAKLEQAALHVSL